MRLPRVSPRSASTVFTGLLWILHPAETKFHASFHALNLAFDAESHPCLFEALDIVVRDLFDPDVNFVAEVHRVSVYELEAASTETASTKISTASP